MTRTDLDRRICIIGAGAAGLSAAHFLRKRGYSRVQVLESSDRVGGKCCSIGLGDTVVEAGALGAMGSYREVLGLAREMGVRVVRPPDQFVLEEQTREFLRGMIEEVGAVHGRRGTLREAFEATHARLAPKFRHWPIFEHCLPFNVQRLWDEFDGVDWPRIWTMERDREVWAQLQD